MSIFNKKEISYAGFKLSGLDIGRNEFIEKMLRHTYERVLFLAIADIDGTKKEKAVIKATASDHYSPKSHGFIHWTARAMAQKSRVDLDKEKQSDGSYIFKRAEGTERNLSEKLIIDFTGYESTDLLTCNFGMMYDALDAAAKGVKTSQGLIVYLEDLYKSLSDSKAVEIIEGQIKALGESLKGGETGYASGGSKIEFISFDIEPTTKAIEFCYSQVAGHFGLPVSAINGVGGSAMSDTGESDRKQTRQAKEFYFDSIINSILQSIFMNVQGYELEPEIERIELLTDILSAVEMSDILSDDDKKLLMAQVGLEGKFN